MPFLAPFSRIFHVCLVWLWVFGLLFSLPASAAVWQYSVPVGEHGARAFLYLPPRCEHVRGLVIALDNLLEKPSLEDPVIREAAADEQLGLVWLGGDAEGKRPFDKGFKPEAGDVELLVRILGDLAEKSGYAEIASVPLLPLGHSAGVPFAVEVAERLPQRVFALIDLKSVLPPRPADLPSILEGIPMLMVKGQFEEWAAREGLTDREASWRGERKTALALRKQSGRHLIGFLLDAGGGHFESGPELTRILALFIRKAAQARLPATALADGVAPLKPIAPEDGWLTDSAPALEAGDPVIAPYADYSGDRAQAFWYFDREIAEAIRNYGAKQREKAPVFVTFAKNGEPAPLSSRGIVGLDFQPQDDGRTFQLEGRFFDHVPKGVLGEGNALAVPGGRVAVGLIRGPAVQIAPGTFRLQFDRGGFSSRGVDLWFDAVFSGDAQHRAAVQGGHLALPRQNTAGKAQHLTFPEIPDPPATLGELDLQATADSGLPVEYYVLSGPAEIEGHTLRFTQLPPRSRTPAEVTVVAYQWGRTREPLWQSAEPVTRIFHLVPAPVPAAFVHPGMMHSRAELEFVKAQIQAGAEPWKSAWAALLGSRYAALDWKPRPRAEVVRDAKAGWAGAAELGDDAMAAYTEALAWSLSGDPARARKAVEILDAWSGVLHSITGHDAKLLAGITGYKLCNAAELLRDGGAVWPETEQQQFRQMLATAYLPLIRDFFPKANGNWDASMIVTMMCIGIFEDDRRLYDRAVDYFRHGEGHGALANYVAPGGQCQETTRDQQHTQLGLGFLADACEVAWKQGDDLWGADGNRLATGFEYTAQYNLGFDVPAVGKISAIGRGKFRPIYEKVYHHYHDRLGLEMKFTKQVIDRIRPAPPHWDHLPWETLMFAGLPPGAGRPGPPPK